MLAGFICPDGRKVKLAECLEECVAGDRCLSLATLRVIGQERVWDGVPSVTQLLNGTMHSYLSLTVDYYVEPESRAYALLGTSHHKLLEDPGNVLSETHFNLGWIKGTADLVEWDGGVGTLMDFKSYGSYKVAKVVGIVKGKEKGTWVVDPEAVDMWEPQMQLNAYRLGLAAAGLLPEGRTIERMMLQITVRDGGVAVAKSRGVDRLMYLVDVPLLPDERVLEYFQRKSDELRRAMVDGWVIPCTDDENWGGNRCSGYCPVNEHCIRWKLRS